MCVRWMMMHTTPNGCIIWYFFFFDSFLFLRTAEREREKSYDPVYVACLIKKRKEEGQDTLESGRGAHHI